MAFAMRWVVLSGSLLAAGLVVGCGDLARAPQPDHSSLRVPVIAFDPPLMEARAAPIIHLWISDLPDGVEPMVLEGAVTERNLRDLVKGTVSEALEARIVAASVMTGDDGWRVIAPWSRLNLGERYSVVAPALGWFSTFDVVDKDEMPEMVRVWPPAKTSGRRFVWCLGLPAEGRAAVPPQPWRLVPGVDGTLEFGALGGIGRSCVRWSPTTSSTLEALPPPLLPMADGGWARVEPSPMSLEANDHGVASGCDPALASAGPACATVQDDRAMLTTEEPWLIGLELGAQLRANVVAPDAPWVVRPLTPGSLLEGLVHAVSQSGAERRDEFSWITSEPVARVVINEVMANPVGPEPQQEWVELYNDGLVDVLLAGWRLEDAGGGVELPCVELPVGRYALLVGEGYDPSSWVDPPPSPGAVMLWVPSVGTAGLSNAGEPIRLVDPEGLTASRIPAIPSKRQGCSIVRLRPEAADEGSDSFGFDPNGGTPGAPNEPGTVP